MRNVFDSEEDPYIKQVFEQFSHMQDYSYLNNEDFEHDDEEKEEDNDHVKGNQKKKVFYINKIAELIPGQSHQKQSYNYNDSSHFERGKSPISREEQLKRNRQSAKNSRQRKKQYVAILEQKNQENLKMIEELNEKLRTVTLERDRLKEYSQDAKIHNFMANKAKAYASLQEVVSDPSSDAQCISNNIALMLSRFGASGTERMAAIKYYMNQIIEILLSDIHKYFLNSSALNQGFLSPETHKIDMEIIEKLDINNIKLTEIMNKYKEKFNRQAGTFKLLTQEFYKIFQSIQDQAKVIEIVFNDLCSEFSPKNLGSLILWFEENKFRRDVKKVRSDWINILINGQKIEGMKRKMAKIDKKE